MKLFSLVEKYYENYKEKQYLKTFQKFNTNKIKFEKPDKKQLKEFHDLLKSNTKLENSLRHVLNAEQTSEYFNHSFRLVIKLCILFRFEYRHSLPNELYIIDTQKFPKELVKALPDYGTNKFKVFNNCVTPEQFFALLNKIEKAFSKQNKKYRLRVMIKLYQDSYKLMKFNGEGITIHMYNRAMRNIHELSKRSLRDFKLFSANIYYNDF